MQNYDFDSKLNFIVKMMMLDYLFVLPRVLLVVYLWDSLEFPSTQVVFVIWSIAIIVVALIQSKIINYSFGLQENIFDFFKRLLPPRYQSNKSGESGGISAYFHPNLIFLIITFDLPLIIISNYLGNVFTNNFSIGLLSVIINIIFLMMHIVIYAYLDRNFGE